MIAQHTRIWRYFGRMRMLNKRFRKGKTPPLSLVLHRRLRNKLHLPEGRRAPPKAPPGAFRTAWGWHRIRATWSKPQSG